MRSATWAPGTHEFGKAGEWKGEKLIAKRRGEVVGRERPRPALLLWFNQLSLSFITALSPITTPPHKPVVFNFLCQLRVIPVRFLVVQSRRFSLLAGPLSASPSQLRPSTAVRVPHSLHFICSHRPLPGKKQTKRLFGSPWEPGMETVLHYSQNPLGVHYSVRALPLASQRAGQHIPTPLHRSCIIKTQNLLKRIKEQNHKFRLIKHLLVLQKLRRPLRNPPETPVQLQ